MRFTLVPALVAGATLVAASPIHVEVIPFGEPTPYPVRFGHAAHQANNEHVATLIKTGGPMGVARKPCGGMGGSRFRQKAAELSNAFRKALGLHAIEMKHHNQHEKIEEQEFHILPFMGTGAPVIQNMPGTSDEALRHHKLLHHDSHHHHHHHPHHPHPPHHHDRPFHLRVLSKAPFGERLLVALNVLGKWEGRAVAFVFGAGLGVLLRMFYVLTVVAYRTATRSTREREDHYVLFVEEVDEEEHQPAPITAPPTYTPDEKAPIAPAGN